MPCENYNFDYEPSGSYIDINQECFSFDEPVDVERHPKDSITFITQTYYRTNFVTPNMCCCGGGGCKPEPGPTPPGPIPPGPCPPPPPEPCPEPDIPEGCFEGVYCNNILYNTIEEAVEDNPCAEELLVGCGVYVLPLKLVANVCIKGRGSEFTFISTEPGQKIVDDNVSIMDVSFVACSSERSPEAGIWVEAANFYLKNSNFKYAERRQVDLYLSNASSRISIINCDFSASGNYGIKSGYIEGNLNIISCQFNNPVALEILSSPDCELRAVTSKFIGQVNYDCASAEFNGCEFLIGLWKKINIEPGCDTEFVSCTFDDQTKSGWVDASRKMSPIIGMHSGCNKKGITYKLNNCVLTSGKGANKTVVFLSEGNDKEPGHIFLNGVEQEIDRANWGKF
jgi:hypothetical protein